jgi:hypothetical protein
VSESSDYSGVDDACTERDLSFGLLGDSSAFTSRGAVGLPVALSHLVSADMLLRHPLSVSGQVSLDLFAGAFSVSLAFTLFEVPCIKPWDSVLGERCDVLKNGQVLLALSRSK